KDTELQTSNVAQMACPLPREAALDLLHEDSGSPPATSPSLGSRPKEPSQAQVKLLEEDPLQSLMAWMTVADLSQEELQEDEGQVEEDLPPLPTRERKKSSYCNFDSPKVDPDEEWNLRLARTGAAGRLVAYEHGERPSHELHLRGEPGQRIVVSFVRKKSRAEKAGVKTGDVLVSIDGQK
ncbi:unnamed protein product, partial [Durusdinium trenchii]